MRKYIQNVEGKLVPDLLHQRRAQPEIQFSSYWIFPARFIPFLIKITQ
jgi:hypothetical protein